MILHAPDGSQLQLNSGAIIALRPSPQTPTEHVAKGTKTIIYMSGKVFGVTEDPLEIADLVKHCSEEDQP